MPAPAGGFPQTAPNIWAIARSLDDKLKAPYTINLNFSIERELKVGESHWYRISLAADQYLYVVVEQCGINVVVALFESDNKKLSEVDTARGKQGSEFLTFIADLLGNYRLEISPAEKNVPAGRYQVQIVALRQPTPDERALEDAQSVRGVA